MLYLTGSVGAAIMPSLDDGTVGYLAAPGGGMSLRPGWAWAADNGCYGKGWPGYDKWLAWLGKYDAEERSRCLFATLPDVVGDAVATLERSLPWIDTVAALGYPVALVTQDGMTPDMVPWDRIDWLFIGGTDAHKLGDEAHTLILAARARGKRVHVGRVNSRRRFMRFADLADSCDGTFLAFGPEVNVPKLTSWIDAHHVQPSLFREVAP